MQLRFLRSNLKGGGVVYPNPIGLRCEAVLKCRLQGMAMAEPGGNPFQTEEAGNVLRGRFVWPCNCRSLGSVWNGHSTLAKSDVSYIGEQYLKKFQKQFKHHYNLKYFNYLKNLLENKYFAKPYVTRVLLARRQIE